MTTPRSKEFEPNADLVRIDEKWQDAVRKALKKKRPKDGGPKGDEQPHPDPRSMEVEDG
jgi:hypothetical protein